MQAEARAFHLFQIRFRRNKSFPCLFALLLVVWRKENRKNSNHFSCDVALRSARARGILSNPKNRRKFNLKLPHREQLFPFGRCAYKPRSAEWKTLKPKFFLFRMKKRVFRRNSFAFMRSSDNTRQHHRSDRQEIRQERMKGKMKLS